VAQARGADQLRRGLSAARFPYTIWRDTGGSESLLVLRDKVVPRYSDLIQLPSLVERASDAVAPLFAKSERAKPEAHRVCLVFIGRPQLTDDFVGWSSLREI
jgi:hypothetical protein